MLYYLISFGIVDGAAKFISGNGMTDVGLKGDVYGKRVSQKAFVGEHAMVSMKSEPAEFDNALLYIHRIVLSGVYNERESSTF